MTPKEKASELVLRYLRIDNNTKEWFNKHIAKQCALIVIDEILNNDGFTNFDQYLTEYWKEVKQEIELL
jgi:short-subunit dehydrogenase